MKSEGEKEMEILEAKLAGFQAQAKEQEEESEKHLAECAGIMVEAEDIKQENEKLEALLVF